MPTGSVKDVFGPCMADEDSADRGVAFNLEMKACVGTRQLAQRLTLLIACTLMVLAHPAAVVQGQLLNANISVVSVEPARIRIDVEFPHTTSVLSFRNAYGGVLGLAERIEGLEGIRDGVSVRAQKLAPGAFQTKEQFSHYRYEVNAAGPSRASQMSHVSWLNRDQGLLMLADLLPSATRDSVAFSSARITIDLPAAWNVSSNAKREGSEFTTDDPENAVFLIGPAITEQRQPQDSNHLSLITSGRWPFASKDALNIARRLIREYAGMTRFELRGDAFVMLVPYPGDAGPEIWSAETRGNVVVLLLGRKASGKRVLSRLGIVLSHELFHLWVPNSLRLAGAYDWFFEGFTMYQALLMDLRLGFISFADYLATLATVYDSYLSSVDRDHLSLLEASERRWTSASSLVYEKGMLAAFLYDLALRSRSDCGESIADVYRQLFGLQTTGQENANETIINLLSGRESLESFAQQYVRGTGEINLAAAVSPYGINLERGASGSRLVIARRLAKAQRKLLGCLGYRS
jgi:M61 glycyl aminopeptidase